MFDMDWPGKTNAIIALGQKLLFMHLNKIIPT